MSGVQHTVKDPKNVLNHACFSKLLGGVYQLQHTINLQAILFCRFTSATLHLLCLEIQMLCALVTIALYVHFAIWSMASCMLLALPRCCKLHAQATLGLPWMVQATDP